jgi:Trypsin-co-occurring domain 2
LAISLTEAIESLRRDLRQALTKAEPDIVFTPGQIELELSVSFTKEGSAGGGIKVYVFDFSAEAKGTQSDSHKVKITLQVSGPDGKPLKLSSNKLPSDVASE